MPSTHWPHRGWPGSGTATNQAGEPIAVGSGPLAIAITPDGATAYVADFGGGTGHTVTPIDTATGTAGKPIKVGPGPIGIAITPVSATAPPTSCLHTSAQ